MMEHLTPELLATISDRAHFLGGLSAVLVSQVLFGSPVHGAVLIILYATIKEFSYDLVFEDNEVSGGFKGGLRDWLGYALGVLCGVAIIFVRSKL